jgi:hypothetical protein
MTESPARVATTLSLSWLRPSTRTKPARGAEVGGAVAGAGGGADASVAGGVVTAADCCTTVSAFGAAGFGVEVLLDGRGSGTTVPSLVASEGERLRSVLAALTPAMASTATTDANPRNRMKNL